MTMTSATISPINLSEDRLLYNLSYTLGVPSNRLYSYTRLLEDLLLDQLDRQLLIAGLESRFNRFLTEEEAALIQTIGDLQQHFGRQAA